MKCYQDIFGCLMTVLTNLFDSIETTYLLVCYFVLSASTVEWFVRSLRRRKPKFNSRRRSTYERRRRPTTSTRDAPAGCCGE